MDPTQGIKNLSKTNRSIQHEKSNQSQIKTDKIQNIKR